MKISIVVPVYNEEAIISSCLDSLITQNYPKKNYEIVVVNDGSTDSTLKIIKLKEKEAEKRKIQFRLVNLKENSGRVIARETGAKSARFENLLFIDSRCQANPNVLAIIKKINYQPIIGNAIIDTSKSIFDYFNWAFRKKLYRPYFGENFEPVYISKNNFDKIPKGTTIFFCDKKLFLSSKLKEKEKYVSDDTKLLYNIVQKKDILRHPDVKIIYSSRTSLKKALKHIFERGPRFVDYYLDPNKRNFWLFIFIPILFSLILLTSIIFFPNLVRYLIFFLFLMLILASVFVADSLRGFFISLFLIPIFTISFFIGILKGLLIKLKKFYFKKTQR
ncbi:MAG: glycosyltransferase [Candidatus Pacebacteria bacterium]|nr:glycosyltransferase [Candidatus Paceibacterota bacterium]